MSSPDATGLAASPVAIPAQADTNSANRSRPIRRRDQHGRFTRAKPDEVVYAVGARWDPNTEPIGHATALAFNVTRHAEDNGAHAADGARP